MSPLHRALARDLWHLRGQVLAAALVIACGLAVFVTMQGTWHALDAAVDDWYRAGRLADVPGVAVRVKHRDLGRE